MESSFIGHFQTSGNSLFWPAAVYSNGSCAVNPSDSGITSAAKEIPMANGTYFVTVHGKTSCVPGSGGATSCQANNQGGHWIGLFNNASSSWLKLGSYQYDMTAGVPFSVSGITTVTNGKIRMHRSCFALVNGWTAFRIK
jgi:hypothetical protein